MFVSDHHNFFTDPTVPEVPLLPVLSTYTCGLEEGLPGDHPHGRRSLELLQGEDAFSIPPYNLFYIFLVKRRNTVCISGPLPAKKRLFGQNMSSMLLQHKD